MANKILKLLVVVVLIIGTALPTMSLAATLPKIVILPVEDGTKTYWTDETGYNVAIAGFSPLAGDYQIKGGSEDAYLTGISFKISNPAFVPAVDKFWLFYNDKNKKSVYKELTVNPDGTVKTNPKKVSIPVLRNKNTTFAVRMLIKKDGGNVASGTTTTVSLDIDNIAATLTSDFVMKTKSGKKIQGEMLNINAAALPVFVLRYAVATVKDACANRDCAESLDPNEPTIARYYFGAERNSWEAADLPKPTLQSIEFSLSGEAIRTNAGDNQMRVSVYTANYPEPIKLGDVVFSTLDAGRSERGRLTFTSPLPFPGSKLLWFTSPNDDDDIDSSKELNVNITSFTWSDGKSPSLTNDIGYTSGSTVIDIWKNRPKFDVQFKPRFIKGIRYSIITATIKHNTPINSIEMFVGKEDSKDELPMVRRCESNNEKGITTCEFRALNKSLRNGYSFVRIRDANGVSTETTLYYFTL